MAIGLGQRHDPAGREETFRRRFTDARSRPYRTADGNGVLVLFDAGPTTQLFHLAVAAGAQGRGLGRHMLELVGGLVPAGRQVWLSTGLGSPALRAAAAAGWELSHTTSGVGRIMPCRTPNDGPSRGTLRVHQACIGGAAPADRLWRMTCQTASDRPWRMR